MFHHVPFHDYPYYIYNKTYIAGSFGKWHIHVHYHIILKTSFETSCLVGKSVMKHPKPVTLQSSAFPYIEYWAALAIWKKTHSLFQVSYHVRSGFTFSHFLLSAWNKTWCNCYWIVGAIWSDIRSNLPIFEFRSTFSQKWTKILLHVNFRGHVFQQKCAPVVNVYSILKRWEC